MMLQEYITNLVEHDPDEPWVMAQLDITNAFNCVDRSSMLAATARMAPALMPWLSLLYRSHMTLFLKNSGDCED